MSRGNAGFSTTLDLQFRVFGPKTNVGSRDPKRPEFRPVGGEDQRNRLRNEEKAGTFSRPFLLELRPWTPS